jgi:3-hydroxyacyl-[acyl-carrier-protein] dehydratase
MKFRLVDKIINFEPRKSIQGIKSVSFEEYQLKSAWGGPQGLPESLLMEGLFQLGNWLILLSSDFRQMGLLVRIGEVQFITPPGPGQSMLMEILVRSYREDGVLFDGRAMVDGVPIVHGKGCLATLAPATDYLDPDNMKVLFSDLYSPVPMKISRKNYA